MISENNFLMDSSAWIEYLDASPLGAKVTKYLENKKYTIITPNIVTAEVISKAARKGKDAGIAIQAIKTLSRESKENVRDYIKAGLSHAEMRKSHSNISLADAIILVLAEKNKAKIITKDYHLKGKNTIFLE
ncbi:MAG TPA: PIN domain-containing protein [archaeon]|nr:PIN domain-containing protein [archaeon]